MNDTQPRTIAPHLITDTGVWRITVSIACHALNAWIRRNDDPDEPVYLLADASWTGDDALRNVENAVYDNPLVLDDFEADIIINTPKYIFIPREEADNPTTLSDAFSLVFGDTADEEIFTDTVGDYLCIYMLMPGLRSFLGRTFAGSRITSHIARLLTHWLSLGTSGRVICADIAHDTVDIAAIADGRLLCAAQHKYASTDDIIYFIANTATAFADTPPLDDITLYLSGAADDVADTIRPYMKQVALTPLPADDNIPLAALLCSYRKTVRK